MNINLTEEEMEEAMKYVYVDGEFSALVPFERCQEAHHFPHASIGKEGTRHLCGHYKIMCNLK